MNEIDSKIFHLVSAWETAVLTRDDCKCELSRAECSESNARNRLVKAFVPREAQIGQIYVLPGSSRDLHFEVVENRARCAETGEPAPGFDVDVAWRPKP